MALKDWPTESLPREKLLSRGVKALSDAELLAIFLRTGVSGMNVIELSAHLLTEFGSLRHLFAADKDAFCSHKGLGIAKFVQLQAVLEMNVRYLEETLKNKSIVRSSVQIRSYLSQLLRNREREVFYVLFLDNQHQMLSGEVLFEGTIHSASVYPGEVVKRSLEFNAAAVILAHNHPSGASEPSQANRQITQKIRAALNLVDIRVLDHFIVGEEAIVSFAERGWL